VVNASWRVRSDMPRCDNTADGDSRSDRCTGLPRFALIDALGAHVPERVAADAA
jgi:hypothetical protein